MIKSVLDEIQTGNDYCKKCGCPLDVCCGRNKISLERLEEIGKIEIEKAKRKQIKADNEYDKAGYHGEQEGIKTLLSAAKKQAGEVNEK